MKRFFALNLLCGFLVALFSGILPPHASQAAELLALQDVPPTMGLFKDLGWQVSSVSVTPSPGSGGGSTNLLLNTGFESGVVSWGQASTSGFGIIYNDAGNGHNGSNWYAWLGGYEDGTDKFFQNVTIPANATSAFLDFYTYIYSDEGTTIADDKLYVYVADPPTNTQLVSLGSLSTKDQADSWQHTENVDLSAYKGKEIGIYFVATNDSNLNTNFLIDDVNLAVTTAGSTTYTVTPSAGANGSISPNSVLTVNGGSSATFTITPDGGYNTVTPIGGTCPQGTWSGTSYTTGAINANCTVAASFVSGTLVPGAPIWTVTPSADSNGALSPSTPQSESSDSTTSFLVTPLPDYQLFSISGCGGTFSGNTYTTGPINGDCSVTASFSPITAMARDGVVTSASGKSTPDISDALAVLRHSVGLSALTAAQLSHADVAPLGSTGAPQGDGSVNISDALGILRRAVGLASWPPAP